MQYLAHRILRNEVLVFIHCCTNIFFHSFHFFLAFCAMVEVHRACWNDLADTFMSIVTCAVTTTPGVCTIGHAHIQIACQDNTVVGFR